MDEAERCSHVAYIYFGKIIADGTPKALKQLPADPATRHKAHRNRHAGCDSRPARGSHNSRDSQRHLYGDSIHALVDEILI